MSLPRSRITRRRFIARAAAALAAPYAASHAVAEPSTGFFYAYVGTYTPNGGGIYLFRIDRASAAFMQMQVVDDVRNPSWLALNPTQTRLYAISEIESWQGTRSGAVVSYAVDPASMQLTRLGAVSSAGTLPAYVSVHPSGKFVFVANYGGGNVAVLPVAADGSLQEASDVRPSVGPRHRARAVDDPPGQFAVSDHDAPHLHMVAPDPSGQFVIANDAGLDLTLIWRLDAQAGRLLPADAPVLAAPSGSGAAPFRVPSERQVLLQPVRARCESRGLRLRRRAGRDALEAERIDAAAEVRRQQSRFGDPAVGGRTLPLCQQSTAQQSRALHGGGGRPAAR